MSDFLTEVDEALKQERLEKIWKDHGNLFLSFIGMIILGTALNAGYQSWIKNQRQNDTALFVKVTEQENYNAQDLNSITSELATDGVSTLVQLTAAGKMLQNNDLKGSYEEYIALSESKDAPEELQALAQYMASTIIPDIEIDEKLQSLKTILDDEQHPWRLQAALDYAILMAHEKQNYTAAREALSVITEATNSVPNRITNIANALDIFYRMKMNTGVQK